MRDYTFEVVFKNGDRVEVICGSTEHARILAKADRIRAGLDDAVLWVKCINPVKSEGR